MEGFELIPNFTSNKEILSYVGMVFVQAIIFLGSFIFLSKFIFQPTINLIRLRNENSERIIDRTNAIEKESSVLSEKYRSRMDGAKQIAEERAKLSEATAKHRHEMVISETRSEAERQLESNNSKMEEELKVASPRIDDNSKCLAEEVVNNILGR